MTYITLYSDNGAIPALKLAPIDIFATLYGALCHDYEHDGFNNPYHVNSQSIRFKTHGEAGVQEKYHFAESYRMIEQFNLLGPLAPEKKQLFKKRMQSCVLATDMARHMDDLKRVQAAVEENEGKDKDGKSYDTQMILDLAVHASDVSFHGR